jgi:hypothetical protein
VCVCVCDRERLKETGSQQNVVTIGCFFLPDRQAPAQRSSQFLLDFLRVIITAIVCLAPVVDC